MYAYQHLRAPNDTNGNPRRLYLIVWFPTSKRGQAYTAPVLGVIDEGYGGKPQACYNMVELPPVDISAGTYRDLMRGAVLSRDFTPTD